MNLAQCIDPEYAQRRFHDERPMTIALPAVPEEQKELVPALARPAVQMVRLPKGSTIREELLKLMAERPTWRMSELQAALPHRAKVSIASGVCEMASLGLVVRAGRPPRNMTYALKEPAWADATS